MTYPLVNVYITLEKHYASGGKYHFSVMNGKFQSQTVTNDQRETLKLVYETGLTLELS